MLGVLLLLLAARQCHYLVGGASAGEKLDELKGSLGQNNAIVMAALLFVLGMKLIGDGISGLSA